MSMQQPVTWQVESQTEATQPDPRLGIVKGMNVGFVLSSGEHGTVFIPYSAYNPIYVAQVIQQLAAQIAAIGGLGGQVASAILQGVAKAAQGQ